MARKVKARRTKVCKGDKKKKCYYVTRNAKGQITKWTNIGKSVKRDSRVKARRKVKSGQGHRGDL